MSTVPATEPMTQDQARAAVARAWQLGTHLARLLREHDVPRPESVRTTVWRNGRIAGYVTIEAAMRAPADLIRLVRCVGANLDFCPGAGEGREQMYARLSQLPAHLEICWVGSVSS